MVRAAQASPDSVGLWLWLDVRSINTKLVTFITPRELQLASDRRAREGTVNFRALEIEK